MIFQFTEYKQFIKAWIAKQDRSGRGQVVKIAEWINVSPSLVSTILSTDRHFSLEQAHDLKDFFGLNSLETKYFIAMVSKEKAGSTRLKKYWLDQQEQYAKEALEIHKRIDFDVSLSSELQAQYYSHVIYSNIRVLCTIENGFSISEMIQLLKYKTKQIEDSVQFLVDAGLLVQKSGRFYSTQKSIHIDRKSPHFLRHNMNWRLQQLSHSVAESTEDLNLTFPCSLDASAFAKIRNLLIETFSKSNDLVKAAEAQNMACLTIDFISYYHSPKI